MVHFAVMYIVWVEYSIVEYTDFVVVQLYYMLSQSKYNKNVQKHVIYFLHILVILRIRFVYCLIEKQVGVVLASISKMLQR